MERMERMQGTHSAYGRCRAGWRNRRWHAILHLVAAVALGGSLALFAFVAPAAAHPAHAYPVREDPAPHALLQAPPSGVTITFSENVNPAISRIIVVDTTNREVDNRDSQVSSTNGHILSVTLPLLRAGTYVVVWKVQSADDGHVTGGSYYFQIARPDGSAPPIPSTLPTGNVPGAGGSGAEGTMLDGPTILQAVATWLALLFVTFWAGGVIWETWILPRGRARLDPDLAAAAALASRRFRQLAAPALTIVLLSNILIVLAEAVAIAGDWSGLLAPQLLRAILFGSRFGLFWWLRELITLLVLYLLVSASRLGWSWAREAAPAPDEPTAAVGVETGSGAIPDWRRELLVTLRGIRYLPARLVAGWRHRTLIGQLELVLVMLLLLAFALSGHAAAVPATIFFPAIAVDLLHLMGGAAWLGGLFYIGLVFVPALASLPLRQRARVLALGLPQFAALAILSAAVLAATGSLNATIRMSSFAQFFTTAYGRTLAIKVELFVVMAAISAYHAFWVRPRLAQALAATASTETQTPEPATESALVAATGKTHALPPGAVIPAEGAQRDLGDAPSRGSARDDQQPMQTLALRLEGWLRREAIVGVGVLVCVALLGAYAGTLATAPVGPAPSGGSSGPFVSQPQQAGQYSIVLKVAPATFGTNTFTVTVKDANGQPVDGATVLVQAAHLEMDMGIQNVDLKPIGSDAPGSYVGQGDLPMAGKWGVTVKVLPPGASDFVSTSFKFVVGY